MNKNTSEIMDRFRGHIGSDDYLTALAYAYLEKIEQEEYSDKILEVGLKDYFQKHLSQEEIDMLQKEIIRNYSLTDLKETLSYLFQAIDYSRQSMMASSNDSIINLVSHFFDFKQSQFADFCSGNGAVLSEALNQGAEAIKGIEISELSAQLSVLRLWLEHGYLNEKDIVQADIFEYFNARPNEKYEEIFSQFPLAAQRKEDYLFEGIRVNKRSDWGFISLVMNQLKEEGKAVVISSMAIETRKVDEEIREHFIQNGYIEQVILLPAGILTGTGIPSFLLVLSYGNKSIRFNDASEIYSGRGRVRYISEEDVEQIIKKESNQINVSIEEVAKKGRLSPNFYLLPKLEEGKALEAFVEVLNSRSIRKKEMDEYSTNKNRGFEIIRSSHVKNGQIDSGNLLKEKIPRLVELKDQDILVTRISSNLNVALYQKDEMTSFVDENFFVLRTKDKKVNPYYLLAYLQSELGQKYLLSNYSGVTIQRINKKDLLAFKIPMVDSESQEIIANKMKNSIEEIEQVQLKLEILEEEKEEAINTWFKEE